MTEIQKQYVLKHWKTKTTTQLAVELNTAQAIVRPADVHALLTKNNIQPITKRDLITKEVVKIFESGGNKQITAIAAALKVSKQLITEIMEDLGFATGKSKMPDEPKQTPLSADEMLKRHDAIMAKRKARSAEIKAARAAFTVYNQTGSPLLDELRNIKTTEREKTLLSTGKK